MRITANISRDDLTPTWTGPIPFRDAAGQMIGQTVSLQWNGRFTVAIIEIDDAEYARLLQPLMDKALEDLWLHGETSF